MPLNSPQQNLAQNLQAFFGQSYGLLVQRTIQALGTVLRQPGRPQPGRGRGGPGQQRRRGLYRLRAGCRLRQHPGAILATMLNNFTPATIASFPPAADFRVCEKRRRRCHAHAQWLRSDGMASKWWKKTGGHSGSDSMSDGARTTIGSPIPPARRATARRHCPPTATPNLHRHDRPLRAAPRRCSGLLGWT